MAWPGSIVAALIPLGAFVGRWRRLWPVAVLALAALAVSSNRPHQPWHWLPPGPLVLLAALTTAPLLVVRRWPMLSLSIVLAANLFFVVFARLSWPLTGVVCWLVAMALCPLLLSRRQALTWLAISEAAIVLAATFVPSSVNATPWDAWLTEFSAVLLAWGIGENLRSRRASAARQQANAAQLRGLRERNAAQQGRAALARDLHDVVAHHVSLIAVQAATVPYQLPDLSPAARQAFEEIAAQARTALDELRAVLGILRTPEAVSSQAPQPNLADVPVLIERMRSSGMQVMLESSGSPRGVPESVALCCYRVAQEALTNAARHAPGASVQVRFEFAENQLALLVCNDLAPNAASDSNGFGLIGMRERVTALNGTLQAGVQNGQFRVSMQLPTGLHSIESTAW
jgi:signal transduction histidine kinase